MMQLQVGGRRHPIAAGETVVGSGADCGLSLSDDGVQPRHAVVLGGADGAAAIRRADPSAEILVNGVRLGADPTPVLHGDKIQLGAAELLVVDPSRVGHTEMMRAIVLPAGSVSGPRPAAGGATGGRMVCLTDGREYVVGETPLVFGRDAGCDVVVIGSDVSRRHAEIRGTPVGYFLVDTSVNGTFVNGERVDQSHPLVRSDVIRVGPDEFRFYAQPVSAAALTPTAGSLVPAAIGAAQRLSNTLHGVPATPVPGTMPRIASLASLLVRSGSLRGTRLPVRSPVVNIGRADYNDLILPEPSVSTAHAKLQRREGIWIITDLGSTNGTFVDGERVTDEAVLTPGTTLKFGEIALLFEPVDEVADAPRAGGTRVMPQLPADVAIWPAPPPVAPRPERPAPRRPVVGSARRSRGIPRLVVFVAVLVVAAAIAFTLLS